MPIENIKALIKIETESNELAEIIHTAINPDNVTAPPMTFHSVYTSNKLEYVINNLVSIETLLATLMDLLTVFQVTENVLNSFSPETR
ncbi:MAG: KEOPS complex subunit Pcc1 [Promethearchaeota archaeon]